MSCSLTVEDFVLAERASGICGCGLPMRNHPRASYATVPEKVLYLLTGTIKFAKNRLGCRHRIFELAEDCYGATRVGETGDGIMYFGRSQHLIFSVVFEDKMSAMKFESAVRRVPSEYRKRKMESSSSVVSADIAVEMNDMQVIPLGSFQLRRIFEEHYQKIAGDVDPSPDFDVFSHSRTSVVELTYETKLRLVDRDDSYELFRQKPEKCHLISQSAYKEDKRNSNNIIFMSRFLHQQFDAIDSSEGIPQFYFEYVSSDRQHIEGVVNSRPCPVYQTIIKVVFKDYEAKNVLSRFFSKHTSISDTEIEITLYFPCPEEFKEYAALNAELTCARWKSYDGAED